MFFGGVTGVFVSIITLATTLVFETFLAQTAGPEWTVGRARLNGFNGMTGMPALSLPWVGQSITLDGRNLYLTLVMLVAATYFGLRMLVASRFGHAIVAIRENATRAEMLGFNVRLYQLAAFVIGSTLAGFSGVFYVTWGQYITPESMSLYAAALPVVWVTVGGRRSLTATLMGTVGVLYVSQNLAIYGNQFALVLLGVVLLAAVMLAPQGFIAGILTWVERSGRAASSLASRWDPRDQLTKGEASMPAMLETKGLVKKFGGDTVIDGLNLSVKAGEIRCIIGPNGAGKSTFLGLVIGTVTPTAGSIFFDGNDVSGMPAYRRIRSGLRNQVSGARDLFRLNRAR